MNDFSILTSHPVRLDLLGGTLDISPLNLNFRETITLNLACSIKAEVQLSPVDFDGVVICSKDYGETKKFKSSDFIGSNLDNNFFGVYSFVAEILYYFKQNSGLKVTIKSGAPPGSGLGGSSTMGISLFNALAKLTKMKVSPLQTIELVKAIEAKILKSGPTGYQDYYPAIYGGVLALEAQYVGVKVHQLYSEELASFLEDHLLLVYSGQSRLSGINNWEVFKAYYDKNPEVVAGLTKIASLSTKAFAEIKKKNYSNFLNLLKEEGRLRAQLFPSFHTSEINAFLKEVKGINQGIEVKVCGAGGGGCFLVVHDPKNTEAIKNLIKQHQMQVIEFDVSKVSDLSNYDS